MTQWLSLPHPLPECAGACGNDPSVSHGAARGPAESPGRSAPRSRTSAGLARLVFGQTRDPTKPGALCNAPAPSQPHKLVPLFLGIRTPSEHHSVAFSSSSCPLGLCPAQPPAPLIGATAGGERVPRFPSPGLLHGPKPRRTVVGGGQRRAAQPLQPAARLCAILAEDGCASHVC